MQLYFGWGMRTQSRRHFRHSSISDVVEETNGPPRAVCKRQARTHAKLFKKPFWIFHLTKILSSFHVIQHFLYSWRWVLQLYSNMVDPSQIYNSSVYLHSAAAWVLASNRFAIVFPFLFNKCSNSLISGYQRHYERLSRVLHNDVAKAAETGWEINFGA